MRFHHANQAIRLPEQRAPRQSLRGARGASNRTGMRVMVPHVPTLSVAGGFQMRFGMETGGRDASQQMALPDGIATWDGRLSFVNEPLVSGDRLPQANPANSAPNIIALPASRGPVDPVRSNYVPPPSARHPGSRARPWLFNHSVVIPAFPINLPSPRQTSAPTSGAG